MCVCAEDAPFTVRIVMTSQNHVLVPYSPPSVSRCSNFEARACKHVNAFVLHGVYVNIRVRKTVLYSICFNVL